MWKLLTNAAFEFVNVIRVLKRVHMLTSMTKKNVC